MAKPVRVSIRLVVTRMVSPDGRLVPSSTAATFSLRPISPTFVGLAPNEKLEVRAATLSSNTRPAMGPHEERPIMVPMGHGLVS